MSLFKAHVAHVARVDPRKRAATALRQALGDFARNGRWGTCGMGPWVEADDRLAPALCAFTDRRDPPLGLDDLAWRFKQAVAVFEESRKIP